MTKHTWEKFGDYWTSLQHLATWIRCPQEAKCSIFTKHKLFHPVSVAVFKSQQIHFSDSFDQNHILASFFCCCCCWCISSCRDATRWILNVLLPHKWHIFNTSLDATAAHVPKNTFHNLPVETKAVIFWFIALCTKKGGGGRWWGGGWWRLLNLVHKNNLTRTLFFRGGGGCLWKSCLHWDRVKCEWGSLDLRWWNMKGRKRFIYWRGGGWGGGGSCVKEN